MPASSYYSAVQKAYIAFYGRPADPTGLNYWATRIDNAGGNISTIVQAFGSSAEARELYSSLSNTAAVNTLYNQIFGRSADVTGLNFYVGKLLDGTYTLIDVAQRIIDGATGADATIVTNKLSAAQSFTDAINTAEEVIGYDGTAASTEARTWMSTVTDSAATLTSAVARIDSTITSVVAVGGQAGTTYNLSTSTDTITGTNANDTINGSVGTLNSSDSITGGAGRDTLDVRFSSADTASSPFVSGVEVLKFTMADSAQVNLSNAVGYTSVVIGGIGTATVSALLETATLTLNNFRDGTINIELNSGAVTNQHLNLVVGTGGMASAHFSAADSEAVNITVNNASATIGTASFANAASAMTLAGGSVQLTIDSNFTQLTSLNAVSATALDLRITSGAQDLRVLGGSGNDTFSYYGSSYNTGDIITGGNGTDTFNLRFDTGVNFATLSQVERATFDVNTAMVAALTGWTDVTTIDMRQVAAATFSGISSGTTTVNINSAANTAASLTLNYASASNVTLNFANSGATAFETASGTQTALCAGIITVANSGTFTLNVSSAALTGVGNVVIERLTNASAQSVTLNLAGEFTSNSGLVLNSAKSVIVSAGEGVTANLGSATLNFASANNFTVGLSGNVQLGSANYIKAPTINITTLASGLFSAQHLSLSTTTAAYATGTNHTISEIININAGAGGDVYVGSAVFAIDNTNMSGTLSLAVNATGASTATDITFANVAVGDNHLSGNCAVFNFAGSGSIHLGPIKLASANGDAKLVINTTALHSASQFSGVFNDSAFVIGSANTNGITAITVTLGNHNGQLIGEGSSAVDTINFGQGDFTAYVGRGADKYYMTAGVQILAVGTTANDTSLYADDTASLGSKQVYNIGTGDIIMLKTLNATAWTATQTGTATTSVATAISGGGGGILRASFTALGVDALSGAGGGTGILSAIAPFAVFTQGGDTYVQVYLGTAAAGSASLSGATAAINWATFQLVNKDIASVTAAFNVNYNSTLGGMTLTVIA